MTPSNPPADSRGAHFDTDHQAVVITDITLRDKDVTREAFRWTTGERGPVVDDPATLDDANLGRLITLFEELRDSSQLIVITHQKRTMQVADALYGVSMRGDGVTTVVSQRIADVSPDGNARVEVTGSATEGHTPDSGIAALSSMS